MQNRLFMQENAWHITKGRWVAAQS